MVLRDRPLHQLQQLIGGVDVGVSQLKALDLDLIVTEVVGQPPQLFCARDAGTSSPARRRLRAGLALPHATGTSSPLIVL